MTARRQMRAAGSVPVDTELHALFDSSDPLWLRDDWCKEVSHRYGLIPTPPSMERMGGTSSAAMRQLAAVSAWGLANGYTDASGKRTDLRELRAAGLINTNNPPTQEKDR